MIERDMTSAGRSSSGRSSPPRTRRCGRSSLKWATPIACPIPGRTSPRWRTASARSTARGTRPSSAASNRSGTAWSWSTSSGAPSGTATSPTSGPGCWAAGSRPTTTILVEVAGTLPGDQQRRRHLDAAERGNRLAARGWDLRRAGRCHRRLGPHKLRYDKQRARHRYSGSHCKRCRRQSEFAGEPARLITIQSANRWSASISPICNPPSAASASR